MKDAKAALRYAKALLNLAKQNNIDKEVNNDMKLIADTIDQNKELHTMLKSPVIKATDKTKVLNSLFVDKTNNITKGLFKVLEENKRTDILESVVKQYAVIFDYHYHLQVARVTTAVPMTKELEEKILEKVVELTGNKTSIENIVNPDILGGFILRVGDVQYDASISNHLSELRREFDNSHYIPKI